MKEIKDVLIQLGPFGVVVWTAIQLGWGEYWFLWSPIPALVLWLSLRMGVVPSWYPGLGKLRMQLMGCSPENTPIQAGLGTTNLQKLQRWSEIRREYSARNSWALCWLDRLYHPVPFHPVGMQKALTWAVAYTTAAWLLPWLFGGSSQIGQSPLLPPHMSLAERWFAVSGLLPFLLVKLAIHRRDFWYGYQSLMHLIAYGSLGWSILAITVSTDASRNFLTILLTGVVALGAVVYLWIGLADKGGILSAAAAATIFTTIFVHLMKAFVGGIVLAFSTLLAIAAAISDRSAALTFVAVSSLAVVILIFLLFSITRSPWFANNDPEAAEWWFPIEGPLSRWEKRSALPKDINHVALLKWSQRSCTLHALWLILPLIAVSAPLWLPRMTLTVPNWEHVAQKSFGLVFFFGLVPWLNALSDWLSVGATQFLSSKYKVSGGLKWILFLDAAIAFSLTVSLYVACIGALYVMRAIGWEGVEPTALINAFQGNVNWNFDSPALWLVMLAFTNLLPTLAHFGWSLWACFMNWLSPEHERVEGWLMTIANSPKGSGLLTDDAEEFARYLLLDHWVSTAVILSFLPPVVWIYIWAIPRLVNWFFNALT